ncbi:hypothetical protein HBN50_03835 [Halobacteriovorax sp. GB3]|uniref:hypothetical protein n=1 Tax=Halobacteriovorax sp. GB3 TaxID=2719615 RepID=UPI002360CCD0|nr:hypothetical protein [Halobacteriovorax sp. GB3]MDD0852210.1 hypothetical protein [Halobacteriovorax sp. GB3]
MKTLSIIFLFFLIGSSCLATGRALFSAEEKRYLAKLKSKKMTNLKREEELIENSEVFFNELIKMGQDQLILQNKKSDAWSEMEFIDNQLMWKQLLKKAETN